jgi:hypothetical protein
LNILYNVYDCSFCVFVFMLYTTGRRVRIVYRGLGRAFVVHKNRDLEENNFFAALGLVC